MKRTFGKLPTHIRWTFPMRNVLEMILYRSKLANKAISRMCLHKRLPWHIQRVRDALAGPGMTVDHRLAAPNTSGAASRPAALPMSLPLGATGDADDGARWSAV